MRRAMVVMLLCLVGGCGRSWYRRDADLETTAVTEEHITDPRWDVPYISINPNPTSRLFDPYDPDFPPLPPDDPAASQYMVRANGMPGYRRWHKNGDAPFIEDPQWRNFLPLDAKGVLVLSQEKAVELAWLHSRDYQTVLETLYTQSLTLTFQRYAFALHWFGTNATTFTGIGNGDTAIHSLATTTTGGFNKLLGAGGQFLAEFANTFVFNFTGSGSTFMTSNLIFNLMQPLLRQFGRDVVMEGLTQSERNLLYAIRTFAHFRKSFYADITTRGGGFLPLLLQVQNIHNLEADLEKQKENLAQHQALFETQQVSSVQLDQADQQLLAAQSSLIQAKTNLETSFDNFKTFILSLPPDIPIRLDESLLAPFQLADPALENLQEQMKAFRLEYRQLLDKPPPLDKLQEGFRRLKDFQASMLKFVGQVEEEIERWKKLSADPGQKKEETRRLRALQEFLAEQIPEMRKELQGLSKRIEEGAAAPRADKRKEGLDSLLNLSEQQIDNVGDLFVLQNQVRVHLIQLQPVTYSLDAAVQYARTNRLDLMNQRAQVVDAWRQIAVTANALKSDLNLNFNATLATPPGSLNPFGFSASANTYSVGVQFAAPLDRLVQRNIYRQSLINYQAARRAYMALDDQIVSSIRRDLRQLESDRLNFEIARRSLVTAARQVSSAEQNLRIAAQAQQTTVTLDVLNAYTALLGAKTNLITNWVRYEQDRIQLSLDLEALQLDEREVDTNDSDNQPLESAPTPKSLPSGDAGRPDDVKSRRPAGQAVP